MSDRVRALSEQAVVEAIRKAVEWYDANLDCTPVDWNGGREWVDVLAKVQGDA